MATSKKQPTERSCPSCGRVVRANDIFCPACGAKIDAPKASSTNGPVDILDPCPEQKSRLVAGLLAFFLGSLGIHNFYLGYTNRGLTQLLITTLGGVLTCGFASAVVQVWAFVEAVLILTQSEGYTLDAKGQALRE